MARGEYGFSPIGSNGVRKLPQAEGYYVPSQRRFAELFAERVAELDAAIQQADRDYATTYQTDWRGGSPQPLKPGEGLDQSRFVLGYWLPFVHAWNAARPLLLTGNIDRAAALVLMHWAARYNDLKMDAGGSWGLETRAPSVVIRGDVDVGADPAPSKRSWWKIALVAGAVGVGYLAIVRPSIKTGERRLAETRKLAQDVGLRSGMSEEEKDRAFDAYYKKKGYPSYLLSTARKVTT
jgi:hypothetical protein